MTPTKRKSACKRGKPSRKRSSITFTSESTDDSDNLMVIEYQENLHSSLEQPSSHAIDQSTSYLSTNQPSSLSSH